MVLFLKVRVMVINKANIDCLSMGYAKISTWLAKISTEPISDSIYSVNRTCFLGHYWFLFQPEVRALMLEGHRPETIVP